LPTALGANRYGEPRSADELGGRCKVMPGKVPGPVQPKKKGRSVKEKRAAKKAKTSQ
jgi:hypothetical protein